MWAGFPCEFLWHIQIKRQGHSGLAWGFVCVWKRSPPFPRASPRAGLSFPPPSTLLPSILCEPQASASNSLTGIQLAPGKDLPTEQLELGRD